jgi:uncharacterized protein
MQTLAGTREFSERLGRSMLRPSMSDQQREFFAALPFLLVGSVDEAGRPWASVLDVEPGQVSSPDSHTLSLRTQPMQGDPLSASLAPGKPLGVLGIALETRRRNRLNGRVQEVTPEGFSVHVDQSFGNCPKYIGKRRPRARTSTPPSAAKLESALLSDAARACIARSDTCFIASASDPTRADTTDPREGVDVSHRGGKPGFVRIDRLPGANYSTLTMPDFAGNNAFNTLGNLLRYPRAGLLFPDFATGDLLMITCHTSIIFEGTELESFEGAERLVRFRVESGWFFPQRWPFSWSAVEPSPQVVATGDW